MSYKATYCQRVNESTIITDITIRILVYRRAEFKIVEQRSKIVWQLPMGSIITPNVLKWLPGPIRDYHCQSSPVTSDRTTESDRCEERAMCINSIQFHQHMPASEYGCADTMAYEVGFYDCSGDVYF